jgi:hypothetical protein
MAILLRGLGLLALLAPVALLAFPSRPRSSADAEATATDERPKLVARNYCEIDQPARTCAERGQRGSTLRKKRRYA